MWECMLEKEKERKRERGKEQEWVRVIDEEVNVIMMEERMTTNEKLKLIIVNAEGITSYAEK